MPVAVSRPYSRGRSALRLARAIGHMVVGVFTIVLRFPFLTQAQREIRVQVWSRGLLLRLGIHLQVSGDANLPGPLLLVANHISWLDIAALHAARFCRFVSKADVRRWPLIGALAHGAGTLFIERASRRDAHRMVHHMANSLRAGDVLAVFPEGTTSDGVSLLPFHANLLQSAIAAEAAVQPVALLFLDGDSGMPTTAPSYVGDDTLLQSVWRTLRTPRITVCIHFGKPQTAQGRNRREWARDLQAEVEALRRPTVGLAQGLAESVRSH